MEIKKGMIVKFKGSKIEWEIIEIAERICNYYNNPYREIIVVNSKNNKDCRNYKALREEDFLQKLN